MELRVALAEEGFHVRPQPAPGEAIEEEGGSRRAVQLPDTRTLLLSVGRHHSREVPSGPACARLGPSRDAAVRADVTRKRMRRAR